MIYPQPERLNIAGTPVLHLTGRDSSPGRPPLLFVHGAWCGAWVWRHFLPFFAHLGYDCCALTLRGHSRPSPTVAQLGVQEYAAEVRAVAAALGKPVVIGHSMGASAAPRGVFPLRNPDQLLVISRHLPDMAMQRPFLPDREAFRRLATNQLDEETRRWVEEQIVPESGRAFRQILFPGVTVDPARVLLPVLALAGEQDRFMPATVARQLAARYRAEFNLLPGLAHLLMLEPEWQLAAAALATWLGPVLRQAARA